MKTKLSAPKGIQDRLQVYIALSKKIRKDTNKAISHLRNPKNQFWRRIIVRLLYSEIEAELYLMKQQALSENEETNYLSLGEKTMLVGKTYEINEKGEVRERGVMPKFLADVRFSIDILSKSFGISFKPDYGGIGWAEFREFVQIRNRLTHPKKEEDLDVSDDEMKKCNDAWSWFNSLTIDQSKQMSDYYDKRLKLIDEKMALVKKFLIKKRREAKKETEFQVSKKRAGDKT